MPPSREDLQQLGALLRAHAYAQARERSEQLLLQYPGDPNLRRLLAEALLRSGDAPKAGLLLKSLLLEQPEHPRLLLLQAERLWMEAQHEEATRLYLASLEIHEDAYVRSRAVEGLIHCHRYAEAETLVLSGLAQHPTDPWLLRKYARLLELTGRESEAASTYARLTHDHPHTSPRDYAESIRLKLDSIPSPQRLGELDRLLKVHPHNPWLLLLGAELALQLHQPEQALVRARQAHTHTQAQHSHEHALLKHLGYVFNKLELWPEVLQSLGQGFILEPRDIPAQQVLFKAARKSGRWAELRTLLVLAYEKHPGFHKLNGLIHKVDHLLQAEGNV